MIAARNRSVTGHFQHRPHDDQHDRRRDEDAERAAGGDRAGGHLHVVAGFVHRPRRHDAENGDRCADDAGRRCKDGRDEQDRDEQGAPRARHHQLHRPEQPLHQPRLFHDDAHEDEQRHRDQLVVQHVEFTCSVIRKKVTALPAPQAPKVNAGRSA